jgi:hypothetical protein
MADPIAFTDSLPARAYEQKNHRIGNPYAFLNGVGISAIIERIYKAANLIDVARELNISVVVLLNWIEQEGHGDRVQKAMTFSSEGYLSEAATLLRAATNDFELKKAKEIGAHGRFMASKLDKPKYGNDNSRSGEGTEVHFVLHMGGAAKRIELQEQTAIPPPAEAGFIRGQFKLTQEEIQTAFIVPDDAATPESIGPFEDEPFEPIADTMPEYLKRA